jgi:hypothetical protein
MNPTIPESKGACQRCGEHIVFPTAMQGENVPCPHCGLETTLIILIAPAVGDITKEILLQTKAERETMPTAAGTPASSGKRMPSDKRILPALLLLWFLWFIGAHAFYAGKIEQGLFYILGFIILAICFNQMPEPLNVMLSLVVLSLLGIFAIGDFIRLVTGAYQDGDGRKITKWT